MALSQRGHPSARILLDRCAVPMPRLDSRAAAKPRKAMSAILFRTDLRYLGGGAPSNGGPAAGACTAAGRLSWRTIPSVRTRTVFESGLLTVVAKVGVPAKRWGTAQTLVADIRAGGGAIFGARGRVRRITQIHCARGGIDSRCTSLRHENSPSQATDPFSLTQSQRNSRL